MNILFVTCSLTIEIPIFTKISTKHTRHNLHLLTKISFWLLLFRYLCHFGQILDKNNLDTLLKQLIIKIKTNLCLRSTNYTFKTTSEKMKVLLRALRFLWMHRQENNVNSIKLFCMSSASSGVRYIKPGLKKAIIFGAILKFYPVLCIPYFLE